MAGWLRLVLSLGLMLSSVTASGFADAPVPSQQQELSESIFKAREAGPTPEMLECLSEVLRDHDVDQQMNALACIEVWKTRFGTDRRPCAVLLKALQTAHDSRSLIKVVELLGEYREPQAVEPLLLLFRKREPFWTLNRIPRADEAPDVFDIASNALIDAISRTLVQIGDSKAIPVLRKRLPERRARVVDALAALNDIESVPLFLDALPKSFPESNADRLHAVAVANALQKLADPSCADRLCEALYDCEKFHNVGQTLMEQYRFVLIRAIARTFEPRVVEVLLARADLDFVERSKLRLDEALSKMGVVALPLLLAEIQQHNDRQSTRGELAIQSIEHMIPVLQPHDWKRVGAVLMQAAGSHNAKTARQALRTLGRLELHSLLSMKEVVDVRVLLKAAETWKESDIILGELLHVMRLSRNPAFATLAAELMKHPSYRVYPEAAIAVVHCQHPRGTELVTPLLQNDNENLSISAARALLVGDAALAVVPLTQLLKNGNASDSRAWHAARTLAVLGDPRGAESIFAIVEKADPRLPYRTGFVVFAAWLGHEKALTNLQELLASDLDFQRVDVCTHLEELLSLARQYGRPTHLPPHIREPLQKSVLELASKTSGPKNFATCVIDVRDRDDMATREFVASLASSPISVVRKAGLNALLQLRSPHRVDLVLPVLTEPDDEFARAIAIRIRACSEPQVVERLMDVAKSSPSFELRDAAVGSLSQLKGQAARQFIESLSRTDPHPYVRARAALELQPAR